ncbi:MAG: hypothetical protein E7017_00920 [Alphaproteobacteria bacterium]|nr:hypothetical protein [Alphaproteobacteria bacterium]
MSDKTADNGKVTVLPQFMNENNNYQNSIEIEEKQSWLNTNLHKLMVSVSIVWFAIVLIYITQFFGWSNLFLMMPDEFGGFLAGVTLPLAIIWVVMAYIDRGTSFKQEAKFLRAYMNQLVYPEDGAPQTAKAMADAIRSQVVELQQVSKLAHEQTSQIKDAIKNNVDDFAKLVGKLDNYSTKTIVELSDGVKFLMANFDNMLNKTQVSSQRFAQLNKEFMDDSNGIEKSLMTLFDKLLPKVKEINDTAVLLREVTNGSTIDMVKANDSLKLIAEKTNSTLGEMQTVLVGQANSLKQVADLAMTNCDLAKTTVAKEIADMEDVLHNHSQKLTLVLEKATKEIKDKTEDITKTAISNVGIINNNIKKGFDDVDNVVDLQIQKIEESLTKHNKDIIAFVKVLDERADGVNKKFAAFGENIAQELDKIMVRTSNLEDSVAMQVANLTNVSDKAVTAMQSVETSLAESVNYLDDKVSIANDDIVSYINSLNMKVDEFGKLSGNSIDKLVGLTDVLNNRYSTLQKNIAGNLNQLAEVDKGINASTENMMVQTAQSIESINKVASLMNKHTNSLTEASSIVVTQSQISEASLAQQQKHITDTAAHVEDIKNELKRQIDELSTASETLEKDAANILEVLKSNIAKMLTQCNDAINKSKTINDNLLEQANQFDTSANRTMAKVAQFENILIKQSQSMEVLTSNIEDKNEKIGNDLDKHIKKLNEVTTTSEAVLNKSISDFAAKSDMVNDISKVAAEYITDTVSGLDNKIATINLLFRQQEADFNTYCEKVSENTNRMSEILRKQMTGIEEGADKLFARLTILEEDTGHKAETVVANSQKSIKELAEIEKLLTAKHELTIQTVEDAITKLNSVVDVVKLNLDDFNTAISTMKTSAGETLQEISDTSSRLSEIQKDLLEENETTWQKFNEQTKYMENTGLKMISQGEGIAHMLEVQKNNITEVINTLATQARLGEASFAQQFKYLTDATVDVATKMQEINTNFKENTGNIFDTTTKLSYEFDVLGDRLLKACDAISKAAKDSIKNIDQTSLRLNQCSEDLDTTIFHSVENINGVFNEYEKYLAGFNTITAETSTGVVEINNLISVQSNKMVQISEDTKKLVDCFNTVLNDTSNKLADRANDAYDKVRSLGQDLKKLGIEMDDAVKLSATHMEKSGDRLRATLNEVAANAERISNSILSSGDVFVKQSQALTAMADNTADKVNKSLSDLVDAGKAFETQGQNIVKESIRFNDTVTIQTKTLTDTANKAEKVMKGLSTVYKDVKVDTFLKDAAKIISVLESVSVDVNRLLKPRDEEDLWKKFYNGDTQVFIRSVAKNMSNSQISALRKEFEKNDELRKLVDTYMKEFETLVEKSKSHEHSAALMAVISGADMGRLYYVLARALNKLN